MHLIALLFATVFSSSFVEPNAAADFAISLSNLPVGQVKLKNFVLTTTSEDWEPTVKVSFCKAGFTPAGTASAGNEVVFDGVTFESGGKTATLAEADITDVIPALEGKIDVHVKPTSAGDFRGPMQITVVAQTNFEYDPLPAKIKAMDLKYTSMKLAITEKAGFVFSGTGTVKGLVSAKVPSTTPPTASDGIEVTLSYTAAAGGNPAKYEFSAVQSLAALIDDGVVPAKIYFYIKEAEWNVYRIWGAPITVEAGLEFTSSLTYCTVTGAAANLPEITITPLDPDNFAAGGTGLLSMTAPGTAPVESEGISGALTPVAGTPNKYTWTPATTLKAKWDNIKATDIVYLYVKETGKEAYYPFGFPIQIIADVTFTIVPPTLTQGLQVIPTFELTNTAAVDNWEPTIKVSVTLSPATPTGTAEEGVEVVFSGVAYASKKAPIATFSIATLPVLAVGANYWVHVKSLAAGNDWLVAPLPVVANARKHKGYPATIKEMALKAATMKLGAAVEDGTAFTKTSGAKIRVTATAPTAAPPATGVEVDVTHKAAVADPETPEMYEFTTATALSSLVVDGVVPETIYIHLKEKEYGIYTPFGAPIAVELLTFSASPNKATLAEANNLPLITLTPEGDDDFGTAAGGTALFSRTAPGAVPVEGDGVSRPLTSVAGTPNKYTIPAGTNLKAKFDDLDEGEVLYLYVKENGQTLYSALACTFTVGSPLTFAVAPNEIPVADVEDLPEFTITHSGGPAFKTTNGKGLFSTTAPGTPLVVEEGVEVTIVADEDEEENAIYTIEAGESWEDLGTLEADDKVYLYIKEDGSNEYTAHGAPITITASVVTPVQFTLDLTTITDEAMKANLAEMIISPKTDVTFKAEAGATGIFSAKAPTAAAQTHTGVDVNLTVVAKAGETPAKYKMAADTYKLEDLIPATLPGKIYFYLKEKDDIAWSIFGAPIDVTKKADPEAAMGVSPLLSILAALVFLFVKLF